MKSRQRIVRWIGAPAVAVVILLAGCGIFGGGGGLKDRTLELTLVPDSKLNWDGNNAKVLQVAVFALTNTERFQSGRVEAIFDPEYDKDWYKTFAADTLGDWKFTLKPGQMDTVIVRYNPGPTKPKRVYLGVIGDFFRAPGDGRERSVFALENKETQRLTITVGENFIKSLIKR